MSVFGGGGAVKVTDQQLGRRVDTHGGGPRGQEAGPARGQSCINHRYRHKGKATWMAGPPKEEAEIRPLPSVESPPCEPSPMPWTHCPHGMKEEKASLTPRTR